MAYIMHYIISGAALYDESATPLFAISMPRCYPFYHYGSIHNLILIAKVRS